MSGMEERFLRVCCSFSFQLLLAVHLFAAPTFKRRGRFWLRAVVTALPLLLGIDSILRSFAVGLSSGFSVFSYGLLLVPVLWYYGMLLFCYHCTMREALYAESCALALQNGVFNLYWLIMVTAEFGENSWSAFWVYMGLIALVYGTCLLVFWKWMIDREGHTLPRYRVIQNAVIILVFVVLLNRRASGSPFEAYVYMAYFFTDVLAIAMQLGLLHETDLSLKNEIIEQLLVSEQKKQQMTAENIELINRKCHDLKHQIHALRHISSEDERNEYIRQVEKAVLFYESAVKTGNETLDLILMEKQLYCKEHGITLTSICDGSKLGFLSTMDLYALFGNALENAIESVSGEAPENRIISFRSAARGGFLSIHFENYLGHALNMRDGLPLTTKDDESYHGFGMLSIRHIVEKYGGTMSIRTDQQRFRMDILLPYPEGAEKEE